MTRMATRSQSQEECIVIEEEEPPVEEFTLVEDTDADAKQPALFLHEESDSSEESDMEEEVERIVVIEPETRVLPYVERMVDRGRTCAQYIYNVSSIYLCWIMLHYFSAHLYVYYCVPSGIYGFLISPFLVAAPHCRAIRWILQSGGAMMDNMWLVFGTWACSRIIAKGG
jgi:hypothetical protein